MRIGGTQYNNAVSIEAISETGEQQVIEYWSIDARQEVSYFYQYLDSMVKETGKFTTMMKVVEISILKAHGRFTNLCLYPGNWMSHVPGVLAGRAYFRRLQHDAQAYPIRVVRHPSGNWLCFFS